MVLCQTDGGIVEADKWIHIAVTSDGDKYKIYADGEVAAEMDFQETDGGNITYRMGGSGGETFAGLMDDYAVFSRALDEDEINLIMESVETFLPVEPQGKLATQWADLNVNFRNPIGAFLRKHPSKNTAQASQERFRATLARFLRETPQQKHLAY